MKVRFLSFVRNRVDRGKKREVFVDELKANSGLFGLPQDFVAESNLAAFMRHVGVGDYFDLRSRSVEDPQWFWSSFEKYYDLKWFRNYTRVLETAQGIEWAKWFADGSFNIGYNCLDRNLAEPRNIGSKPAYICVNEYGREEIVTYAQLDGRTNKFANALLALGVAKGDLVCIYMSNTINAIVGMLACAKIGAIHNVIFSGLGPSALLNRLRDSGAKVILTSAEYSRRGKVIRPVRELEAALQILVEEEGRKGNRIPKVIIDNNHLGEDDAKEPSGKAGYPRTWFNFNEIVRDESDFFESEETSSEDPLFILHTSGTTGRPKAVVHTHAGFGVVSYEQTIHPLDLKYGDVLFWATDIGWISAHIWVVYGLLLSGGTAVLYDGAMDYPNFERPFELINKYKVTIFGISPTAVRLMRKELSGVVTKFDFSKIKTIGLTGEPIDRASWLWLYETIGHGRARIFNNSGGTEVGGAILGVSSFTPMKPASLGGPQLGFDADVFDDEGRHVVEGMSGYLVVKKPWPAMTRGLWKDRDRYLETYWSKFPGVWFHGDWARIDEDGYWFILGRVDDVIKVSGHRIGSGEVEDTLLRHPAIAEAAVVGKEDPFRGQRIVAYVVLKRECDNEAKITRNRNDLLEEIAEHVSKNMGKIARPSEVIPVSSIPKTSTGKILRKELRAQS